ncbi:apolipoprotein B receptor [Pteronotus mesoamericanus]|uniref:apolipoprotein B receptor n=1 Tax=Pteronotus mesoamericanus TaxID=1884717 RepID=UPI0023EE15F2|nr:apolipoprotein B receptor [Pteronotus parnellii mesoamericanus]
MDFLRLHLPGLHQALRGALDSFSSFVSYLMGDEVPTAERREAWAAEELGEVAAGRPGRTVEEEAQEALECLRGSQSKGDGGLRAPEEARRHQEGSSATEQTWSWGECSSHGPQGDRQDAGAWEAAKAAKCQKPSAPFEARKKVEAGSEAAPGMSSQAQESQESNEQEVRTWEQEEEEEEEEVRAREPGRARGAESEWTWLREPEGKTGADRDGKVSEQSVKEEVAEEIQGAGAKETGREEDVVAVVKDGQSTRAQGTQEPGADSEDGAPLSSEEVRTTSDRGQARTTSGGEEIGTASVREETGTTSGEEESGTTSGGEEGRTTSCREETDLLGVRETEHGAAPGDRIQEGTRRVWAIEEASDGAQEEEVDENREAEVSLVLKQNQTLGTEGVGQEAKDQTAEEEAAEGQGSEWEAGKGFEGQEDQDGIEAKGRQDGEIRTAQGSLEEEVVQAGEAKEEKESVWAIEAKLSQDKMTNEAEGDADFEATPETRPEKDFREERSEEEAQVGQEELGVEYGGLEHWVTEGWEPELIGGLQTPTEQLKEGQGGKEEPWSIPALSKEETERSLGNNPRNMDYVKSGTSDAEAWENQRRDVQRGNTQEEKVGTEEGEGKAAGGGESAVLEVLEAGREWKKVKEAGCGAESQELGGRCGVEVGTGQSLGESDARKTKDEEMEAAVLWGADRIPRRGWRLEEAARSLQDSEDDTRGSSLAAETVENKTAPDEGAAGTREGLEREAGEAGDGAFGGGWDSEGREEAGRGEDLEEAAEGGNRGGQEFGLGGSAEEVTGRGGQVEAFEARKGEPAGEWVGVGESVAVEGSYGMDGFTSGSQTTWAEGTMTIVEASGLPGGQMLLEKETGVWQARDQWQGSEGQRGGQTPEEEAQMPCDVEDFEVTRHQRAEAEEIDPEDLEDIERQEDQSTNLDPAEAEPGPQEEAARSAPGDAHGSWSEALLPASRLDTSVPRSRVLLSRSSLQRRSRPSFRRIPTPEQQKEPASPPPEEELSAPEQRHLQPEGPPEPSTPRPEGTPVPARRRPLGHGFGLAHSGMMQELQARLGQPKPQ